MKLLIKIGVQNSCTPISLFVPPTLPVNGYKKPQSKISVDTLMLEQARSSAVLAKRTLEQELTGLIPDMASILFKLIAKSNVQSICYKNSWI